MGQGASERLGAVVKRRLGRWVIATDGTRGIARRATDAKEARSLVGEPSGRPAADARLALAGAHRTGTPTSLVSVSMDPATVLQTLVLMLVAYLAGSIPMGVVVARVTGGTDPRTIGSGRTGGTNALRALGRGRAAIVVIGDLLKGALPVLLARYVTGGDPLVEVLCGAAAVAGAIWSVFAGFRSGRGVGTGVGTMLVIQPAAVLLATPVFIGVILLTRYVSLGS